jgi:hypothetical protein
MAGATAVRAIKQSQVLKERNFRCVGLLFAVAWLLFYAFGTRGTALVNFKAPMSK